MKTTKMCFDMQKTFLPPLNSGEINAEQNRIGNPGYNQKNKNSTFKSIVD